MRCSEPGEHSDLVLFRIARHRIALTGHAGAAVAGVTPGAGAAPRLAGTILTDPAGVIAGRAESRGKPDAVSDCQRHDACETIDRDLHFGFSKGLGTTSSVPVVLSSVRWHGAGETARWRG